MTETKRAAPADGERQPVPSVPGHLQEAVKQLVQSDKPKRTDEIAQQETQGVYPHEQKRTE